MIARKSHNSIDAKTAEGFKKLKYFKSVISVIRNDGDTHDNAYIGFKGAFC
jgi:hypothetical protein